MLRIALMWLVALAVPVQGVAAATMLACGPGHAAAMAAVADSAMPHHAHAGNAHHAAATVNHDTGNGEHGALEVASQKCSACASCCTAAMLPTAALFMPAAAVPEFDVPSLPSDVAVFLTDGPERPPRSLLL